MLGKCTKVRSLHFLAITMNLISIRNKRAWNQSKQTQNSEANTEAQTTVNNKKINKKD